MEQGIVALYQKCVHLGCKVPWCETSQWFECPCHGSKYNRVGEKQGGPAPRGLDRFVVDGLGRADHDRHRPIVHGPPIGTDTTGQGGRGAALRVGCRPHVDGAVGPDDSSKVILALTFRTILIIINIVAFAVIVGDHRLHGVSASGATPSREAARTSRRSWTTRSSRGATSSACCAGPLADLVLIVAVGSRCTCWSSRAARSGRGRGFEERAVERGAVLFANEQMEDYDATQSLLCADCHGVDASGGSANFVIRSEAPGCDPAADVTDDTPAECLPQQVHLAGPATRRRAPALPPSSR